MKAFVASMIVLAAMVVGGICGDMYLSKVAEEMSSYVFMLEQATFDEDFDKAKALYEVLDAYWQKNALPLAALVDHTHIGEASKSLREIEAAIKSREGIEILLASARAKEVMKFVAENEHFYPANIL